MKYTLQHIAKIVGSVNEVTDESGIEYLITDSRKLVFPKTSLFFSLPGPRRDGEQFIPEMYNRGCRFFVIRKEIAPELFPESVFIIVEDVLVALQKLAASQRQQFNYPVIGITGSNGKTIVKEWLYQLLRQDHHIVRSPRSFNSQIGVPLSVWQMNEHHDLAIFEAGISQPGEMDHLERIIQPTIGIFTNLGDAHSEGFKSIEEKAKEKCILFRNAGAIIFSKDGLQSSLIEEGNNAQLISWSKSLPSTLQIEKQSVKENQTIISGLWKGKETVITIPFTDKISIENAIICWALMLHLNYKEEEIQKRMLLLEAVDMRMQLKKAVNNCYLLNDSYSNDLASLDLAIDYLLQQSAGNPTTIILSDLLQSGLKEKELYKEIATRIRNRGIGRVIGIGAAISANKELFNSDSGQRADQFYASTDEFLLKTNAHIFKDEYILLKGARVFEFERISHWLEQKVHQTVLEINLSAMAQNLKTFQQQLSPQTKLMAMVKAFSYGSGSAEVARLLQFHKVDYLAVAYADEGVELRKAGISLPIMVMSPDEASFDALVTYNLEPEIYSFPIYHAFHLYLENQAIQLFPVHIKFNTGMNRLGFEIAESRDLAAQIQQNQTMAVRSVFSHLVSSEDPSMDPFTQKQVSDFETTCVEMKSILGYSFIRHIANSSAIARHKAYQFDMVRLGIGLYGVESAKETHLTLETVLTLKTTIAQIRKLNKGETVGYSRAGVLQRDSLIATVRIGYADGYDRGLSKGKAAMMVNGKRAPVIGQVCMDMTMIDITDISNVKEGDEVEVFGNQITVNELAQCIDSIPYEVMTGISQRVKRVYLEE